MNDDDIKKYFYIVIIFMLSIVSFAFLFLFTEKAQALEIVQPSESLNINGTNYYGYSLPTRPTSNDNTESNSIFINESVFQSGLTGGNYSTIFAQYQKLYVRDLPSEITNSIKVNNNGNMVNNMPNIWTGRTFNTLNRTINESEYLSFGFHPGNSVNSNVEMLESGFNINYNSYYSYTFDMMLFSPNGAFNSTNGFGNTIMTCTTYIDDSHFSCSTGNSSYIIIDKIINTNSLQYYRVSIPFNSNLMYGFTNNAIAKTDSPSERGVYGKYLFSILNTINNMTSVNEYTQFWISQPYNIKLWSTTESLYCNNNCWNQDDTDNNQTLYNDSEYMLNSFLDKFNALDYYGFGGIINLTFDYIKSALQPTSGNSCQPFVVSFFDKDITLPSGCSFWNRNDVSTFKSLYELMFTGIVCYILCWRIYKDILNLYTPGKGFIDGNEVDDL